MCPVLIPSFSLPTREAIQGVFDARGLDCKIELWKPSLGSNWGSAIMRGHEAVVSFDLREIHEQDRQSVLLFPEHFEDQVAIYETVKGGEGMYSNAFSDCLESAVGELTNGLIYFEDSPTPSEPWYLENLSEQGFEWLSLMEFVVENYEVGEKFHPSEMLITPGLTPEDQMRVLNRVDFALIDTDRKFRTLNQDGGYRWLTREGKEKVQQIQQQNHSDRLKFQELGA